MTSIIRVGQSKFVTHPIDEDSQERTMNCINTLSDLEVTSVAEAAFLDDTKTAYTKMLAAQEVFRVSKDVLMKLTPRAEKSGGEEGGGVGQEGRNSSRRSPNFQTVQQEGRRRHC